jgi:hypothetical protein
MQNNMFNGRVNVLSKKYPEYDLAKCNRSQSSNGYDIVSKDLAHTPVSALFFSKTNIDALQKGICNRVFNESNGRHNIGMQSEIELKIIMRSIYFSSLRGGVPALNAISRFNDPKQNTTLEKVKHLNSSVLEWSVPRILSNIQQFERYKTDISTMPGPLDRPSYLTSSGTKVLELESFF